MCVLPADIPHTEIRSSPQLIAHLVYPLATQPSHIEFCRFSMLHQFYAMRSPQMFEYSRIMTSYKGVICRGTHFYSAFQCFIWPAPRVGESREFSSGAFHSGVSGCSLGALPFN